MEVELNAGNFEAEVINSGLPVLVDFSATWCGPCRMLAPIVGEIAAERAATLKVGKVDVDACPELAARFGIVSIPALLLFRNGAVAAQSVGYMSKDEIEAKMLG